MSNSIFPINDFRLLKEKVLNWVQQFSTFCFLDNHQYQIGPHTQECLLGAGIKNSFKEVPGDSVIQLQNFIDSKKGRWLFGHLNYDLKNELERLSSSHKDHIQFPELFFFEPVILIRMNEKQLTIEADEPEKIFNEINIQLSVPDKDDVSTAVIIKNRVEKEEYISIIRQLQHHILRGDCYEINFCQEFFAEQIVIDPLSIYRKLSEISPNPFS
ncbi:MAG: aminodeoxychorismate synthase component I, partial [Chitinophagaceae bacterium]